jgi:hypothetical protein
LFNLITSRCSNTESTTVVLNRQRKKLARGRTHSSSFIPLPPSTRADFRGHASPRGTYRVVVRHTYVRAPPSDTYVQIRGRTAIASGSGQTMQGAARGEVYALAFVLLHKLACAWVVRMHTGVRGESCGCATGCTTGLVARPFQSRGCRAPARRNNPRHASTLPTQHMFF